jgi:hypothetical protein
MSTPSETFSKTPWCASARVLALTGGSLGSPGITRRATLAIFDLTEAFFVEPFGELDWYFFFETAGLEMAGAWAVAEIPATAKQIAHEHSIRILDQRGSAARGAPSGASASFSFNCCSLYWLKPSRKAENNSSPTILAPAGMGWM